MDTISPTNGYDQCLDKWIEKTTTLGQSVSIFFSQKIELHCSAKKKTHFINNKQKIFYNELEIYRKVMTKLNENIVTYVNLELQTMTSMNYFDSSRKNLTYILNGSQ